jgi:hypothetical protein
LNSHQLHDDGDDYNIEWMSKIILDNIYFSIIRIKMGEGTTQGEADRKLDGRKKCDVKLGEVSH